MAEKSDMITLKSSDGEDFEIKPEAAALSQTIKHMIEEDCVENGVPLPNVNSNILAKVIEYCNKHVAAAGEQEDLKAWDADFIKVDQATLFDIILAANYLDIKGLLDLSCQTDLKAWDADFIKVDQATLFDIILAANYLDIKGLLDLSCQTVADMIKGKTPEEIRKTFNIENDFSPEEEAEIRKENQWAFE